MTPRPRRSVLYLPASNQRALAKARTLDVDAVILDLEDAVAPEAKESAREAACAAVREGGFGHREVAVRVNAIGTPWHDDDVRAVVDAGPDAVVVPKVGSADEVRALTAAVTTARSGSPSLWAMIETPRAVLDAAAIAGAGGALACLVLGTNDLVKELGAQHVPGRAPVLGALGHVVLAARAHDVAVLDGVYNDVTDAEGFAAECRQAWQLGFDGKTLIHPSQVAPANAQWAPSEEQVADARELISAFEAALAEGRGVVTHRGRMVENLHVETARRVLDLAEAVRRS